MKIEKTMTLGQVYDILQQGKTFDTITNGIDYSWKLPNDEEVILYMHKYREYYDDDYYEDYWGISLNISSWENLSDLIDSELCLSCDMTVEQFYKLCDSLSKLNKDIND